MRVALAVVLFLLLAPLATAHLNNPLPRIQSPQSPRAPEVAQNGTIANVDMLLIADPFRHILRYQIEPWRVDVEYRSNPSSREDVFRITFNLTRFIEFRDVNGDGIYDPKIDALVRSWKLDQGTWTMDPFLRATVGGVPTQTTIWKGRHADGLIIDIQLAASGRRFLDEGATVHPNDIVLYIDIKQLPPRGTGSLFALEGAFTSPAGSTVRPHRAEEANTTTAFIVDAGHRMGYVEWGGEAMVDGRERILESYLGSGTATSDGRVERPFNIDFPIMNREARVVLVMGADYEIEKTGVPGPSLPLVLVAMVAIAVAFRRVLR